MSEKLLSTQVYDKIKKDVISLQYAPGSILKERELAQLMGVSRTPIREAIQRLLQETWLVQGEGKKLLVRPVTIEDIHEIIQIRNMVESTAVSWITKSGEQRVLAGHLDAIIDEMKCADSQYAFTTLDIKFHSSCVECMKNDRLCRFWYTVQEEVLRMGLMALKGKDRFKEVILEHERLVEALWSKDTAKIIDAMSVHLKNSYASLLSRIDISDIT